MWPTTKPTEKPAFGWLGPDGRFWSCGHAEHENVADSIVEALGADLGGDVDVDFWSATYLEKRGYLHVNAHGDFYQVENIPLTQAQIDWLFSQAERHAAIRDAILNYLRDLREDAA